MCVCVCAFCAVELTEIEKARAVAERALKVIHFREQREKYNVWIAYLNLENLHGTPTTMQKVCAFVLSYVEFWPHFCLVTLSLHSCSSVPSHSTTRFRFTSRSPRSTSAPTSSLYVLSLSHPLCLSSTLRHSCRFSYVLSFCDLPVYLYRHFSHIHTYTHTHTHTQLAVEKYEAAAKKWGSQSLDLWSEYAGSLYFHRQLDDARPLLKRALEKLPKKDRTFPTLRPSPLVL